jgi:hypothetical protein
MTKTELKEITKIVTYHKAGLEADWVARALSALVRCAMTKKSKAELLEYADILKVRDNPEFIC